MPPVPKSSPTTQQILPPSSFTVLSCLSPLLTPCLAVVLSEDEIYNSLSTGATFAPTTTHGHGSCGRRPIPLEAPVTTTTESPVSRPAHSAPRSLRLAFRPFRRACGIDVSSK